MTTSVLAVDRALSHIYPSPDFPKLVREVVRRYDDKTDTFFQWSHEFAD